MTKPFLFATAIAFAALPVLALAAAEAPVVTQKDRRFSVPALTIPAGSAVIFSNDDTVRHNVAVRTPAGEDRTGIVQEPGTQTPLTFGETGRFQVHCLIHPQMRMRVTVE